jgi:hypothetical protein
MHGEILEISCCSITVKSDISGGDGLGSILLSSEYNFIMFLSIEQRLQEVNEPAKIFPRLPKEIEVLKVKKQGQKDTSKDFVVRRYKVQNALNFLRGWFGIHIIVFRI